MTVDIDKSGYWTRIKINGLPHVVFLSDSFLGFITYMDMRGATETYWIQYVLKHQTIEVEFNSREHWESMLVALNEHFS